MGLNQAWGREPATAFLWNSICVNLLGAQKTEQQQPMEGEDG